MPRPHSILGSVCVGSGSGTSTCLAVCLRACTRLQTVFKLENLIIHTTFVYFINRAGPVHVEMAQRIHMSLSLMLRAASC